MATMWLHNKLTCLRIGAQNIFVLNRRKKGGQNYEEDGDD